MKHIKKTFRFERPITEEEEQELEAKFERVPLQGTRKPEKDTKILMISKNESGNKLLEGFYFSKNGNHYSIPEPDPILIYFHIAYSNWKVIKEREKTLLNKLSQSVINESVSNDLYNYFAVSMGFTTSLFICIEAFINSLIPDDYEYREIGKLSTISYNKDQVQYMRFETKWTDVLKEITGKDLHKDAVLRQRIRNLKEFRDMIVHTKMKSDGMTPYDYLFKKALNFNYEQALEATRDFINYYKPDYVVECDCGANF